MKKKTIIAATVVVVLILSLCLSASNPFIVCKLDVPDKHLEAIELQSRGVYSNRVPLVPICVSVDAYADGRIYYTIHYFPVGSVGMSYAEGDGFNMEKPLTGL